MTDERRPSLRAEQVRQTRAALVDAGRRCFGGRGFAATSVEDLAREARVTTGALYHHFPTKAVVAALRSASEGGTVRADEPETLARLLLGALVRAGMLIASSEDPGATRDAVAATLRGLLTGWAPSPETTGDPEEPPSAAAAGRSRRRP